MSYETLELLIGDGIARIRLHRPQAANSINPQMAKDLLQVALRCDEDPSVRAVVLEARGPMFCAGGDLSAFSSAGEEMPALLKEMTVYLHAAIGRLVRMAPPVIAAVGGTAAGAGFSLVCAADLAVAAESARLTMAYTRAGLTPDGSSTYFLPRLIGRKRTLELMLTNRVLTAAEAAAWGLVNEVVADDRLEERVLELAAQLAAGATRAFGVTKELVLGSASESLETQMEHESRAIADAARTADAREGIGAFLEKRAAVFRGE